jgi:phage terminase large subunit-like protein
MYKSGIKRLDDYCEKVHRGKIDVCELIKKAVQRHYSELAASKRKKYPYYFEPLAAEHAIFFFENLLVHWKGESAGKPFILESWEVFIVGTLFGWLRKDTRTRRFREAYIEIPRKNGKSPLAAGIALYMLTWDEEPGAEVYTFATQQKQAKIVFKYADRMAKKSEKLSEDLVYHVDTVSYGFSSLTPMSKEHKGLEGLNTHCAVNDEVHAWKGRDLYDVVDNSTGARRQPLIVNITTAGDDREGIAYDLRTYGRDILNGVAKGERFFVFISTIDESDLPKWDTERVWKKANPNYGVSVYREDFIELVEKARISQAKKNDFLTKRLNVWVSSHSAWMAMEEWEKRNVRPLPRSEFQGWSCYLSADLASKIDLCSVYLLFRKEKDLYYVYGRNYLPEAALERSRRKSQYRAWADEGYLTITDGDITDFDFIEEDIIEFKGQHNVLEFGYDPYQATHLVTNLQKRRVKCVEIGQTVKNLSEPMKELDAWVRSGKIEHAGDPVLSWAVSNVVAKLDKKDNIFPVREQRENKIDPAVAVIMSIALHLRTALPDPAKPVRRARIIAI